MIAANEQTFADMLPIKLDALKHADEANAINSMVTKLESFWDKGEFMEDQTQKLLAELIRQALIRIHTDDQGVDAALYSAINILQEQNIVHNIVSSLQWLILNYISEIFWVYAVK